MKKYFLLSNYLANASLMVLAAFFLVSTTFAQNPCGTGTVLFNESFDEAEDATSGTDATGKAWTATCTGCVSGDVFQVKNGVLKGNDTNGPATFSVAGIDVSAYKVVAFSFDYASLGYEGSGNLECLSECTGCVGLSDPTGGGCNNCWDFLYGELASGGQQERVLLLGEDCTAAASGSTVQSICTENLTDKSNVTINIVMAMWAGSEYMDIDNVKLIGYTEAEVAACSNAAVTGACPVSCPDLSAVSSLEVSVTESTCPSGQSSPSGGSIAAPTGTCPSGSTLQYSTDGTNWSTTLPTYNQSSAITVSSRCACDDDNSVVSAVAQVTTVPGVCASCPDFANVATPEVQVVESTCTTIGGTPSGGSIAAPTGTCPSGSTLQYSTDGTNWSTTLPSYDQTNAITVSTRCNCDVDDTNSSTIASVTTTPGSCPGCPTIDAQLTGGGTICLNGSSTSVDITFGISGGVAPYTIVYSDGVNQITTNATTVSVSPSTNTTYTLVSVTDSNNCAATVDGTANTATCTVNKVTCGTFPWNGN